MNRKTALVLAIVAMSCPLVTQAEDLRARMGEAKNPARFQKMVDEAADVYGSIAKGLHGEVPGSVLRNAQCIAVLPNVITGAVVVGGTHGDGLVSCKDSNKMWSQPAAISLNQGSIGLQAGAKSADLVLFFQTDDAVKALKRGNFELGADIGAVAGNYDSSVDTSRAGVVVYTRTEGLFAGAAVNGSKIGNDQEELTSYYGKKVDYRSLLEGKESPDSSGYTQKLTKLFP